MKKIKSLLRPFIAGLIVVLAVGSVAYAAAVTGSPGGPLVTPSDPEQSTTMPQRIASRKTALKIQLSSVQLQIIAAKCQVAQTGLQDISAKGKSAAQTRAQTYTNLATQLATMTDKLERQGSDATSLKTAGTQFYNSINKYLADWVTYQTAMDDMVVMDCTSDPTGFEATLQSARQLRSQLTADVAQIKAILPGLTQNLAKDKESLIKAPSSANGQASQ